MTEENFSRLVPAKQPSPYQLVIVDALGTGGNVVLFGMNQFLLTNNFGTTPIPLVFLPNSGITVTPAQSNVSYLELLQQSASQSFETSLIRIQTSNLTQLTQILNVVSKDANGQKVEIPIITQSYFSANQFQSTILDVPYAVKIDGNTSISFTMLPFIGGSSVVITLFPSEKINQSRILGGGSALQLYSAPSVPVAIPMFSARPMGADGRPKKLISPARR